MDTYINPLCERYASQDMLHIFSPDAKFVTWRKLWLELARAQQSLGLAITDEQIAQLSEHLHDINYDVANAREREVRHDVMAHVYAYGKQCPAAQPIIHLGATSMYVVDNTDLMLMRDALTLIRAKIARAINALCDFAEEHSALPTLGYTHFQSAQPTTVGKRACMWIQDLLFDYVEIGRRLGDLRLLGSKGATGTQASFMSLFNGDEDKIVALDDIIARAFDFPGTYPVTGQTYSRKIDSQIAYALSGIAQSACKFATDMRLLCHMKEIEEPFESTQIGSSAMAYKRNPMRSERICSLARFVIADAQNPAYTAATQWLERTLDDSANKRISLPEVFLATDAILELYINIASGMVVHNGVIRRNLLRELPFFATENLIMAGVKAGGDRQTLHEIIRMHSVAAGQRVKDGDGENDLIERLKSVGAFGNVSFEDILRPELYTGRASSQTDAFIKTTRVSVAGCSSAVTSGEVRV